MPGPWRSRAIPPPSPRHPRPGRRHRAPDPGRRADRRRPPAAGAGADRAAPAARAGAGPGGPRRAGRRHELRRHGGAGPAPAHGAPRGSRWPCSTRRRPCSAAAAQRPLAAFPVLDSPTTRCRPAPEAAPPSLAGCRPATITATVPIPTPRRRARRPCGSGAGRSGSCCCSSCPSAWRPSSGCSCSGPDGEPTRAQQAADSLLPPGTTYPEGRVVSVEHLDVRRRPGGRSRSAPPPSSRCSTARAQGDFQQVELSADVVAAGRRGGRHPGAHPRRRGRGRGRRTASSTTRAGTPIVVLAIAFAVVVGLVARLRGLAVAGRARRSPSSSCSSSCCPGCWRTSRRRW